MSFKLCRSSATTSNRLSKDIGFRDSCLRLIITVLSSPRPTQSELIKLQNRNRASIQLLNQTKQSNHSIDCFKMKKKAKYPYHWPEHSPWVSPESLCSSLNLAGEIPSFQHRSFSYQYYKLSSNSSQRRFDELEEKS